MIGSVWDVDSWAVDAWGDGTWGDSVSALDPEAIIVTVTAIDRDIVVPYVNRTVTVGAVDRTVVVPNS